MSVDQSQTTSRGLYDPPAHPGQSNIENHFVPKRSFPVIPIGVEPVCKRESADEPMERVHVSHPYFRREENSYN